MSEQKINIKNTYVATVKDEIAEKALAFYKKDEVVEKEVTPSEVAFPEVSEPVKKIGEESLEGNKIEPISIPSELKLEEPVSIPVVDDVAVDEIANNMEVNSNVVDSSEKVEETFKIPDVMPVTETVEAIPEVSEPVKEVEPIPNPEVEKIVSPIPNVSEPVKKPEPIPNPVEIPNVPVTPIPSEPVNEPKPISNDSEVPVFGASHETNLLEALAETSPQETRGNIDITPENVNIVREFGVDEPAPMPEAELAPANVKVKTLSKGFVNSKILLVVVIVLFLASCIFLGYEIFSYFSVAK